MEKSQNKLLRQQYKSLRDSLSDTDRREQSRAIKDKFLALLESDFKGANIFLCFYPFGSEVDLIPLYESLLSTGQELYFPISDVKNHVLSFMKINDLTKDFKRGAYGIMEPIPDHGKLPDINQIQSDSVVAITPGLVFDKTCNRMGYGAGFYDRFFASYPNLIKVGVGFDIQIVEALDVQEHDVPMDYIITNKSVLKGA
ncbi:MAG: 5-formyltetrahydrofolate cyclo-ligase [Pseudobutyrivibrio sp.]|nr:5-formyltetrahydrofolate cyclo-ligase [Pseudobutyrivibrio sp.]